MNPITIDELLYNALLGLRAAEQSAKSEDYLEWLLHERARLCFLMEHLAKQALNMRADLFLIGRKVCVQGTPSFEDEVI